MKHYLMTFIPTEMQGGFLSQSYVKDHQTNPNKLPEVGAAYRGKLKNYETADEALLMDGWDKVGLTKERKDGSTVVHFCEYSLSEFVLDGCGALSAYFYNASGKLERQRVWQFQP